MKQWNWRGVWLLLSLVATGLVAGCQTGSVYQEPSTATHAENRGEETDKLRVGDTVRVTFSTSGDRQVPPHEEQIKQDGSITLFLIGSIQAAGKTTGELQSELQQAYSKYYVSMTVTVQAPERYYSVGGEVKNPKRDVYVGGTTVIKAIQSAGDFTDFANRKKVRLTRASGKTYIINCDKALMDPRLDLPVYPGDSIHVPRRFW